MKRQRVEDLGRIYEKCENIFSKFDFWQKCNSKHSIESFVKYLIGKEPTDEEEIYIERVEELHNQIRWLKEYIDEIHSIAGGYDFLGDEDE